MRNPRMVRIINTWRGGRTENKPVITKGERGWQRYKLGIWDQQIHTIMYQIDKQGPAV